MEFRAISTETPPQNGVYELTSTDSGCSCNNCISGALAIISTATGTAAIAGAIALGVLGAPIWIPITLSVLGILVFTTGICGCGICCFFPGLAGIFALVAIAVNGAPFKPDSAVAMN